MRKGSQFGLQRLVFLFVGGLEVLAHHGFIRNFNLCDGLVINLPVERSPVVGGFRQHGLDFVGVTLEILLAIFGAGFGEKGVNAVEHRLRGGAILLHRSLVSGYFRSRSHRRFVINMHVGEERLQAVVIAMQQRIELMVVAAGARQRHPQEGERSVVGDIIQQFLATEANVGLVELIFKKAQEAQAG